MGVLPRVFFTITEAAAKWGYSPSDVAGWAHQGMLEVKTGIPPVQCGTETVAGLVVIPVADILPMFRRVGNGPREMTIRRVRAAGSTEWSLITSPEDGVTVSMDDLLIMADEVARFEDEHEIFGRPHASRGPEPRFEWDDFWRAVATRVHERGVPSQLKEMVDEFSNWFLDQTDGKACPSDSVIRKKLSPLWRSLRHGA